MRIIGQLESEAIARRFSDYLLAKGFQNQVEEDDGRILLWVHDEEQLEDAKELLSEFKKNPDSKEFDEYSEIARRKRKQAESEQKSYEKRHFDRTQLNPLIPYRMGKVTLTLMVISVLVYIIMLTGGRGSVSFLFITNGKAGASALLEVIGKFQIWRLFTPIFIHFNILHILFNMLWLNDLGSMIESRKSGRYLLVLVLTLGFLSNIAQFLVSGPLFGGMSGVVYGLLGFIWMRGKFDPASGLFLHSTVVTMMIVWFFFCLAGFAGNIANTAHAAGLILGMVVGVASSPGVMKRLWSRS
ncbi:MAG: rhomboid family intramembrane serine protease [Verrucomicrobia bacterium]|nr:rhomboid family intramembrane serine protease [Verrucomicrobiota bacterium]MCF7708054.1 rhomboid family intramembrane serine protease [Verrucomicrobiota bacterium]